MSPKPIVTTPKDVRRRLLADGWVERPGKGDHVVFRKPGEPRHVVLDMGRREVPVGTLRQIYRSAGWEWR